MEGMEHGFTVSAVYITDEIMHSTALYLKTALKQSPNAMASVGITPT